MRVLLIEHDLTIALSIKLMLKPAGFNVYTIDFGEAGVDLENFYGYDIILLGLNLPDMSELEVVRSLRVAKIKTPVLLLSRSAGFDKVREQGFGADECLIKPFSKDELIGRIQALVRRSYGLKQSVVTIDDLVIDLDQKSVAVAGERINLTDREYQILELLSLRQGTTQTKGMFLNYLYGGVEEPGAKIIDVLICKLRKKLASASNGKSYIETVWGQGYVLRTPSDDKLQISA